jgi:hypothetical protein
MKTPKGKQTSSQRIFEANAKSSGFQYAVCRSLDEFMNVVTNYLTIDELQSYEVTKLQSYKQINK